MDTKYSVPHEQDSRARTLLVQMLQEAAQLEHCLLNTYLYSACSLKSTPQEFTLIGTKENLRKAQQFERVRGWKQNILAVAHEEMRHLHYVQCMIRALGERPSLGLPARNAQGNWVIPNWDMREGKKPFSDDGTPVPIAPLDGGQLRNFIMYESTDSLQDTDPFSAGNKELFERLYDFELALRIESMLVNMTDEAAKANLRAKLLSLYKEMLPLAEADRRPQVDTILRTELPALEEIRFQSIADFYRKGILPLYEQAFAEGWVTVQDRNLVDEQLNPNYAAEGFLPVGPIGRSARFARLNDRINADPLSDYKQVDAIVEEIVAQGEGASHFEEGALELLAKVEEIGIDGYIKALANDARSKMSKTPDWLARAQNVRKSHLYLFAMMWVEHGAEQDLAQQCGVKFEPARKPLDGGANAALDRMIQDIPAQFNACYIAMLAWLSRMYESRHWASDKSRRMAIEMVATWPLMSLAIRPFLELASFFPVDLRQMFRVDMRGMPMLPVWAVELVELYESDARSEAINERMDWLVVRVLSAAATWAREQTRVVSAAGLPAHETDMILTRLRGLSRLDEFERQFPYRVEGGYSDRAPSLSYQRSKPDSQRFEEDPTAAGFPVPNQPDPNKRISQLFKDQLVLRLRFRGWGLVQLATDPDPPTDESGATGTIMLHPADGNRKLDRSLVFQDYEPAKNIRRSVSASPPPLGVDCVEAALMAPGLIDGASAGYRPLQVLQSSGAVQTTGVQQDLVVEGLHKVAGAALPRDADHSFQLFLSSKDNVRPYLVGDNHLIWQDGEPIDPFVLGIYAGAASPSAQPALLMRREVYNEGLTLREMEPYQRLLSCRGPAGFDSVGNIPSWAVTPEVQRILSTPGFPVGFLRGRAADLAGQLQAALREPVTTQAQVDTAISLAERLLLVAQPRGTTVGWLTVLLHYGHTLSGQMEVNNLSSLLEGVAAQTGLALSVAAPGTDRMQPGSRWLVGYTKGLMDVDAVSDFVYGELYVPLAAKGDEVRFAREWAFPLAMRSAVMDYACNFGKPFWGDFAVDGDTRSIAVQGLVPGQPTSAVTLVETLEREDAAGYVYSMQGFPGMAAYMGRFSLSENGEQIVLRWECRFQAATDDAMLRCYALLAASADTIGGDLAAHFGPAA